MSLNAGDALPPVALDSVAHGRVSLPEDVPAEHYSIVLVYRAHW